MNDRTVHRAIHQGTRTVPVESRSRVIRGDVRIFPDEVQLALEMARDDRTEQAIAAYKARKAAS